VADREEGPTGEHCRACGALLSLVIVDLGASPLCESFLRPEDLDRVEPTYSLRPMVCETCFLVQLPAYVPPAEIFTEYAYFSSYSTSWLEHSRAFAERITAERDLGPGSLVVELGSNDGYLLRQFVALGIPVLGIEPAANVAEAATAAGVRTLVRFFDAALAEELRDQGMAADLIVANNTLAQIPGLNDAVAGLARLLAPDGRLSIEVPHLLRLLDEGQFDTIYHEHFSYFSLLALRWILERHGLVVEDVEELPTHGGSLRVIAGHAGAAMEGPRVAALLAAERERGLDTAAGYTGFAARVERIKDEVLEFLLAEKRAGRRVVGYGAPGKANTLLNYAGIRSDLLAYTVDRNPYKHGRFTPGTRIPILPPERLSEDRPDVIWILPWNLAPEISAQLAHRAPGSRLMVAIPRLTILDR